MSAPASNYPFALLRPVVVPPRLDSITLLRGVQNPAKELAFIFSERHEEDFMAFDIETNGVEVTDPDVKVVGVGLSDSRGSLYVDLQSSSPTTWPWLLAELGRSQVPLLMHNAYFDYSFILRDLPPEAQRPYLQYCTHALFRLTSTEDWEGFSWGLKAAQKHLLGWQETNEVELDKWLIENGHYSDTKLAPKDGYYYVPSSQRWVKPKKSMMYLAPYEVLGHYCALDADSTYLVYKHVFAPVLEKFHALAKYASPEIYGNYIILLIEQKLRGMSLDEPRMRQWAETLETRHQEAVAEFYSHPDILKVADAIRQEQLDVLDEQEPDKYKPRKKTKEPNKFKKNGQISPSWTKWNTKQQFPLEVSHKWLKWDKKMKEIGGRTPQELINLNSPKQKIDLFYNRLGFPVLAYSKNSDPPAPSTGKDAVKGWGELGKILTKQNKLIKELQFATKTLLKYNARTNAIHPGVIVPGTSSGRLAGAGGLNIQQLPKSLEFLSCFKARPGYKLVELDFSSLEQVVMTELTKDPTLMSLYGPSAPKHQDVYLFNGAQLPGIGPKIRASGYDPFNPTKESIDKAKLECKKERNISKTITLGSTYGMGAVKLQKSLELEGIRLTENEARDLHSTYWNLYQGIKIYEKELIRQWELNNGWYLNAVGRPLALSVDNIKDICNRTCQSGGHDVLILYIIIVATELSEAGIEWYPWLIDMHDEMIVEVKEEDAVIAADLMQNKCLKELNKILKGVIPLQGEAVIADSWGEIKC
jgi:hypothetical protein